MADNVFDFDPTQPVDGSILRGDLDNQLRDIKLGSQNTGINLRDRIVALETITTSLNDDIRTPTAVIEAAEGILIGDYIGITSAGTAQRIYSNPANTSPLFSQEITSDNTTRKRTVAAQNVVISSYEIGDITNFDMLEISNPTAPTRVGNASYQTSGSQHGLAHLNADQFITSYVDQNEVKIEFGYVNGAGDDRQILFTGETTIDAANVNNSNTWVSYDTSTNTAVVIYQDLTNIYARTLTVNESNRTFTLNSNTTIIATTPNQTIDVCYDPSSSRFLILIGDTANMETDVVVFNAATRAFNLNNSAIALLATRCAYHVDSAIPIVIGDSASGTVQATSLTVTGSTNVVVSITPSNVAAAIGSLAGDLVYDSSEDRMLGVYVSGGTPGVLRGVILTPNNLGVITAVEEFIILDFAAVVGVELPTDVHLADMGSNGIVVDGIDNGNSYAVSFIVETTLRYYGRAVAAAAAGSNVSVFVYNALVEGVGVGLIPGIEYNIAADGSSLTTNTAEGNLTLVRAGRAITATQILILEPSTQSGTIETAVEGQANKFTFTATANQVSFTGLDDDNKSLLISANNDVSLSGIVLVEDLDFERNTAGNTLTLIGGLSANVDDILHIISRPVQRVNDTVTASEGGIFSGPISATSFSTSGDFTAAGVLIANGLTLPAGTIDVNDLGSNSVSTVKVLDENITTAKISGNAAAGVDDVLGRDGWVTPASGGGVPFDKQRFTVDGTYTIPTGATTLLMWGWAGGGGGNQSHTTAGQGATNSGISATYGKFWVNVSELTSSTLTIDIGTGGAGGIPGGSAALGGSSTMVSDTTELLTFGFILASVGPGNASKAFVEASYPGALGASGGGFNSPFGSDLRPGISGQTLRGGAGGPGGNRTGNTSVSGDPGARGEVQIIAYR